MMRQHYCEEISLALGRRNSGLRIEVHEAQTYDSRYLDFAFLIVIYIGRTPHPVFCRDLSELLPFLQGLVPLIEAEVRCAGEVTLLERLSSIERRSEPAAAAEDVLSVFERNEAIPSPGMQPLSTDPLLQESPEYPCN